MCNAFFYYYVFSLVFSYRLIVTANIPLVKDSWYTESMKSNDKSIIFHIDVNSAYLSWTALDELEKGSEVDLRTIPSIIGGDIQSRHGVVLAKSIPAKAYHIKTGEPVMTALRKCPGLTMHKPDHALYSRRSHQLMDYLRSVCPDIEQVSIDECYMDYTPICHQFPDPLTAAAMIKDTVRDRFGFTVNVGISDRKVLAKMASDFEKPDKVHTLYSWEIQEKMWPLPVSRLFSCGGSSVDTLRKLEILTIGDLARADVHILELHLKSHGRTLWEFANGMDDSRVLSVREDAKGVGNSSTFSQNVVTGEAARRELLILSESVCRRLRQVGKKASMISVEIKYSDFRTASHQTTLEHASNSTDLIYKTACQLFAEIWSGNPVRLLGVRTSRLEDADAPEQLDLFSYMEKMPHPGHETTAPVKTFSAEKQRKLDQALDSIRERYGTAAITRGSLLDKKSAMENSTAD